MLPLIGIVVVVLGFAFRVNPLVVVASAAIATGLGAGHSLTEVIGEFGKAFINSRSVAVVWLALPVVGMLERAGLKERARDLIAGIRVATAGRLLIVYLALRQIGSALGLTSLGGHPQVVRPLLAPMAEAAAEKEHGPLPDKTRWFIRAHAAAADNIGLFFGEDVFIAIGSILLIKSFLEQNGIAVEPADLAKWAIPTAFAAFIIHGARLVLLDRRIKAMAAQPDEEAPAMIKLPAVYILMGLLAGGVAIVGGRDRANPRRFNNAAFWGLYSVTFFVGSLLPDFVNGVIVLLMVGVAGIGKLGPAPAEANTREERDASARRWGNKLFIPALAIPFITIIGAKFLKAVPLGDGRTLIEPKDVTIVWLGIGTVGALLIGMVMLRPKLSTPIVEARRLWDSVGWAVVLPQMLAALGAVFAIGGVGKIVAELADRWLPLGTPLAAVITYALGMALLTILMGNAFAAFPVMTAGIALPLIVQQFGGNVVIVTAVGMLSGFCGTLMTPMAANFNIVPARLLDLPDDNAVIKAQIPTALGLLGANIVIMYFFAFR